MRGWVRVGLVAAVACGPSTTDAPDLAELCGQEEPVQVLPLAADEIVAPVYGATARHGDRYLYGVRTFDTPVASLLDESWTPSFSHDFQTGARVESVGRCGEDRRVVAEGFAEIRPPEGPDEPWLGYDRATGELFAFDPDGDAPTRLVARAPRPQARLVIGPDVFMLRADAGDFARVTVGADAIEAQTLVDDAVDLTYAFADPTSVVVLRDDGTLVDVVLASGEATGLSTEGLSVRWMSMFRDPRWLVWLPGEPGLRFDPTDPASLPTQVWLLDRETGASTQLAEDGAGMSAQMRGGVAYIEHHRVGAFPERELVDVVGGARLSLGDSAGYFADDGLGHHVVFEVGGTQTSVYELRDGAFVRLGNGGPTRSLAEGALWRDEAYEDAHGRRVHDVVRTSMMTLESEVVRTQVYSSLELPDGRWGIVEAEPPSHPGTFLVLDAQTGQTQSVADDVLPNLFELGTAEPGTDVFEAGELVYQVVDADSDRSGLWRVRFE